MFPGSLLAGCRLGRSSVPTAVHRGAPQVLFPSTETFSASHDFYFSISFVPAQPHSPPGFLLVLKKEKCSTAGTSPGEGQMLGK